MTYLFVGLGNVGKKYEHTRHNIGFDVVDEIAKEFGASFKQSKLAYTAEFRYNGNKIILVKPTTYMNLSGQAFRHYMDYYKIPIEQTLTIVDDLALPFGRLKLKPKGSHGGHNGLRNIQEHLGNHQYPRIRFGIGNQFSRGQQVNFVLGKWTKAEQAEIDSYINDARKIALSFVDEGIDQTMNEYN